MFNALITLFEIIILFYLFCTLWNIGLSENSNESCSKKDYIKPTIERHAIYTPPYHFSAGRGKIGRPLFLTEIYKNNYDGNFEKDEEDGKISHCECNY